MKKGGYEAKETRPKKDWIYNLYVRAFNRLKTFDQNGLIKTTPITEMQAYFHEIPLPYSFEFFIDVMRGMEHAHLTTYNKPGTDKTATDDEPDQQP